MYACGISVLATKLESHRNIWYRCTYRAHRVNVQVGAGREMSFEYNMRWESSTATCSPLPCAPFTYVLCGESDMHRGNDLL